MNYIKSIVCFANSRKRKGRCVAGKEWNDEKAGGWVRFVSMRDSRELQPEERRYEDQQEPQPLDILLVACQKAQPLPHQSENHVIDPGCRWHRQGALPRGRLGEFLDRPYQLWNMGDNSYQCINNRIPVGEEPEHSLYLIAVNKVIVHVGPKVANEETRSRVVRGEFHYNAERYRLAITDPAIERKYLVRVDGKYQINNPLLCISLSEPYQGHYYKLIATIL